MTPIPGTLDIRTDIEALILKIEGAIAASTVKTNDATLGADVQADHAEQIVQWQAYLTHCQGFYSIT